MEDRLREYVTKRVAELEKLIEEQEPESPHRYALLAGKYEVIRLAIEVLGIPL